MSGFIAVGVGALLGAWLRWGLSAWLNPAVPALPMGTLAVNIGGGYAVGLAVAYFNANPSLSPEWRCSWHSRLRQPIPRHGSTNQRCLVT